MVDIDTSALIERYFSAHARDEPSLRGVLAAVPDTAWDLFRAEVPVRLDDERDRLRGRAEARGPSGYNQPQQGSPELLSAVELYALRERLFWAEDQRRMGVD